MNKIVKIGLAALVMAFLANMLFGGNTDKEADIPALIRNGALVIDTRSPDEFSGGHIEGAINIPYNVIAGAIGQHTADRSESIIVYCHSGIRSAAAKQVLEQAGFTNVINAGGYDRMRKLLSQ
jgi:phage shock protein E